MQWLETIRVLGPRESIEALTGRSSGLLEHLEQTGDQRDISVFDREGMGLELLVCIRGDADGSPAPSREGLLLAEHLASFGLVRHETWRQRDNPPPDELAALTDEEVHDADA